MAESLPATEPLYTVYIRNEAFQLSSSQIQFDSPNFFTRALTEDWLEGSAREVKIFERDPELFRTQIELVQMLRLT